MSFNVFLLRNCDYDLLEMNIFESYKNCVSSPCDKWLVDNWPVRKSLEAMLSINATFKFQYLWTGLSHFTVINDVTGAN